MEENKYYTPKLSDLFIGYRCEWNNPNENDIWLPIELSGEDIYHYEQEVNNSLGIYSLRTPYLTLTDIEKDWKYDCSISNGKSSYINIFKREENLVKYRLEISSENYFSISGWFHNNINSPETRTLFRGEVKSVNEFEKLQKWLKII